MLEPKWNDYTSNHHMQLDKNIVEWCKYRWPGHRENQIEKMQAISLHCEKSSQNLWHYIMYIYQRLIFWKCKWGQRRITGAILQFTYFAYQIYQIENDKNKINIDQCVECVLVD